MDNKELIKQFEQEFEAMKKELKFSSTIEDLDRIFFVRDFIMKEGYLSKSLSRMICARIVDTYISWNNYLHALVMPNPASMINITESHLFTDDEKNEIAQMMNQAMALISTNTLVGLTKDKGTESKLIDDAVSFWDKTFNPYLKRIMKRVNDYWKDKAENPEKEKK